MPPSDAERVSGLTDLSAYHAPVSPLSANFGAFRVRVAPGAEPGAPLRVTLDPPVPYLRLLNEGRTGKRGSASTLTSSSARRERGIPSGRLTASTSGFSQTTS